MRTLSRDRYETSLLTLRRLERERGFLLTEVDVPALELGGPAIRIASLSASVGLHLGTANDLLAEAVALRARFTLDRDRDARGLTITIQIARELDAAEEAALAEEYQGRLRLASGGGL